MASCEHGTCIGGTIQNWKQQEWSAKKMKEDWSGERVWERGRLKKRKKDKVEWKKQKRTHTRRTQEKMHPAKAFMKTVHVWHATNNVKSEWRDNKCWYESSHGKLERRNSFGEAQHHNNRHDADIREFLDRLCVFACSLAYLYVNNNVNVWCVYEFVCAFVFYVPREIECIRRKRRWKVRIFPSACGALHMHDCAFSHSSFSI